MTTPIINYTLDTSQPSNPDGSLPFDLGPATIASFGTGFVVNRVTYYGAIDTSADSQGFSEDLSSVSTIDPLRFHAQAVFSFSVQTDGIQNIIQSDRIPFAVSLFGADGETTVTVSVKSRTVGWRSTETYPSPAVTPFDWHYIDLVYDVDTLAVFLDGSFVSLHGFGPQNTIDLLPPGAFTIAGGTGTKAFNGLIAAVKLDAGIPIDLETDLDRQRVTAQWYITTKLETLRPIFDMGNPLGPPESVPLFGTNFVWTQLYDRGLIAFSSAAGIAFEIHGPILQRYNAIADAKDILGYLCSDIGPAGDPADPEGTVATFSKGAIYLSGLLTAERIGAIEVIGRIYLDYMTAGGPQATGLPQAPSFAIPGGSFQLMARASWLWKSGTSTAFYIQGAIRDVYESAGTGWAYWGFPTSNEMDVTMVGQTRAMKMSQFEQCTIYWSQDTGTHWIRGDILIKFNNLGGPNALGLPTSDEIDIPGTLNGKMNSFEKGIICWFGSFEKMAVARPFHFYLGVINTIGSDWITQNDVYVNISIRENGTYLVNRRYPDSGDSDNHNIWNPNYTFDQLLIPSFGTQFDLVVQIEDADTFGSDNLGTWTKTLDASNAWGFADHDGIWISGPFEKVNSLTASAKADIDPKTIDEATNWWGWRDPQNNSSSNPSTDRISRNAFAEAFPGVDSEPQWWDLLDGLDSIFYEIAIAHCARIGNCVGNSLEAAYARQGRTPFAIPLNQYSDWSVGERSVNVKHTYQYGAQALWWFVSQVLSGSQHNPKDVFNNTQSSAAQGKLPVLNFFGTWWFGGVGHTVLPIAWDTTTQPWTIKVHDPDHPDDYGKRVVTVDPDDSANWFNYVFQDAPEIILSGGRWSGSRMFYSDMDIYGNPPRVPTWDLIALIVAGVIICLGDGVKTSSLTDPNGVDLDGTSDAAADMLKQGKVLNGYFVPYPACQALGNITKPEVLLSGQVMNFAHPAPPAVDTPRVLGRLQSDGSTNAPALLPEADKTLSSHSQHLSCGEINHSVSHCSCPCHEPEPPCSNNPSDGSPPTGPITTNPSIPTGPPTATTPLPPIEASGLSNAPSPAQPTSSVHTISGTERNGNLAYYSKSTLHRFELSNSTISSEEAIQVHCIDLGNANGHYVVTFDRAKNFTMRVSQRHGLTDIALSYEFSLQTASEGSLRVSAAPGLFILDIVPSHENMIAGGTAFVKRASKGGWAKQKVDLEGFLGPGGVRFKTCPDLVGKSVTVARLGSGGAVLASKVVDAPPPPA
jgi:hypothetical protein